MTPASASSARSFQAKYLVILLLLVALVLTVRMMIRIEDEKRAQTVVTIDRTVEPPLPIEYEELSGAEWKKLLPSVQFQFRATGQSLLQREGGESWNPLFIKGVDLGVALPGRFAPQFAMTEGQYREWFEAISSMNANTIRTYTLLPPAFYEALANFNRDHLDRPLYLMQGIWATAPENDLYTDELYQNRLKREIADVIDAIHGNGSIFNARTGTKNCYVRDVSKWIAGIILGREWEPKSVAATIDSSYSEAGAEQHYEGPFLQVHHGNAMEVWLGKMLNFTVGYETQKYSRQHPVSFINWQALDPLHHSSEYPSDSTRTDYDGEVLDFNHFHSTPLFVPGLFASYHAYPYFPDFIYLEKRYRDAGSQGYALYLKDLHRHHPDMPVIISEYGIPSSRSPGHLAPSGYHQGGHGEVDQAHLSAEMTRTIHQEGFAGAIYFEWIDEWFKDNKGVHSEELPAERRLFWHNRENAEQNYGIIAVEPPQEPLLLKKGEEIAFHIDAENLLLKLHLPQFDLETQRLDLLFDTYDLEAGLDRVPGPATVWERGAEFLVRIGPEDSATLSIDSDYGEKKGEGGATRHFKLRSRRLNEERTSVVRESFSSQTFEIGRLKRGETALDDWSWSEEEKTVTLRIPWNLIGFSDPSSRSLLWSTILPNGDTLQTAVTDGIQIQAFWSEGEKILGTIPKKPLLIGWEGWDYPDFRFRPKPLYDTLKAVFSQLEAPKKPAALRTPKVSGTILSYPRGRSGALSLEFVGCNKRSMDRAKSLLRQHRMVASFASEELCQARQEERVGGSNQSSLPNPLEFKELKEEGHLLCDKLTSQAKVGRTLSGAASLTAIADWVDLSGGEEWLVRSYSDTVPDLKRELRLFRNSNRWIAPASELLLYRNLRENSTLEIRPLDQEIWQVTLSTTNIPTENQHCSPPQSSRPLSVRLQLPFQYAKVSQSATDGLYTVRNNALIIDIYPNRPVRIERVEP